MLNAMKVVITYELGIFAEPFSPMGNAVLSKKRLCLIEHRSQTFNVVIHTGANA